MSAGLHSSTVASKSHSQSASTRRIGIQLLVAACILGFITTIVFTTASNLSARGIPLGFGFLTERAGFAIPESVLPYSPDDSNGWAILVGVTNSLFVSGLVILLATVVGTFLGLARLSENPLVAGLARGWIEAVRNTPLLLTLLFVYAAWWQVLPAERAVEIAPGVLASMRGIAVPRFSAPWDWNAVLPALGLFALTLGVARRAARRAYERYGRRPPYVFAVLAVSAVALLAMMLSTVDAMTVSLPRLEGRDFVGGFVLTPELFTIVFGLTLYTTGFIAEIVRSGIESVPRGQWEAARSLALPRIRVLRLVIIPQMLRAIVPAMTSQYINVVKNSTLALAVGYSELMVVMGTMINKTSHAIEGTVIIICVYLVINLGVSALLGWYNRRVALQER